MNFERIFKFSDPSLNSNFNEKLYYYQERMGEQGRLYQGQISKINRYGVEQGIGRIYYSDGSIFEG